MFCSNCGTNLPDGANFCLTCGKPQTQGLPADAPKSETCEINYKVTHDGLTGTRGYFCVDAIGPDGPYMANRSEEFSCGYNTWTPGVNHAPRHKALVDSLVKDGWEPTGDRGEAWWQNRFRRTAAARKTGTVDLLLLKPGKNIVESIKVIRALTHLDLGDAKKIAGTPNSVILRGVSTSAAMQAQALLEKAGVLTKIV